MAASSGSRFFVNNLPADATEGDLEQIFCEYGEISKIEVKSKENLVDPGEVKRIAFVTLNVDKHQAQQYLRELNFHKIRGQRINIELAKESFLERLQRERASAAEKSPSFQSNGELRTFAAPSGLNKRKVFDDEEDDDDNGSGGETILTLQDHEGSDLNICKKSARSSLCNGRVVIQSNDFVKPLHVIAPKSIKEKQKDGERLAADQKRRETLLKRKHEYHQRKSLIRQSLKEVDGNSAAGTSEAKITRFDVDEDADRTKVQLFDDTPDEEQADIEDILGKRRFLDAKSAAKLVKMQGKQSSDPRFRIDERFVQDHSLMEKSAGGTATDDATEESQWQLHLMEEVAGVKLSGPPPPPDNSKLRKKGSKKMTTMLRYDPTKEDHEKYEKAEEQKENTAAAPTVESKPIVRSKSPEAPAVSKEVFYMVTDTLQEALKNRGNSEQFSLLSMFGKFDEHLERRDKRLKDLAEERILVDNAQRQRSLLECAESNPFKYDSSASEDEEDGVSPVPVNKQNGGADSTASSKSGQQKSAGKTVRVASESFFLGRKDQRLKDGSQFFFYVCKDPAETAASAPSYDVVRDNLKKLIKTKIAKSKRQMTKAGFKQHKTRKRQQRGCA